MRVQLFITCLIDSFFPKIGEAVVDVLIKAGAEVVFPEGQTCCGQPAMNVGLRAESRRMAQRTITLLEEDPSPVVLPSGSCAAMIRHGYPELFAGDQSWLGRARELAQRTYEFSQLLTDQLLIADFGASSTALMAYFPSCHLLRSMGIDRQPKALLAQVAGPPIDAMQPECCGFGGAFAVQHAEVSQQMLARTLDQATRLGAEVVVGCDVGCLMHIEGGLRRKGSPVRCNHLAQVLAGQGPGLR